MKHKAKKMRKDFALFCEQFFGERVTPLEMRLYNGIKNAKRSKKPIRKLPRQPFGGRQPKYIIIDDIIKEV